MLCATTHEDPPPRAQRGAEALHPCDTRIHTVPLDPPVTLQKPRREPSRAFWSSGVPERSSLIARGAWVLRVPLLSRGASSRQLLLRSTSLRSQCPPPRVCIGLKQQVPGTSLLYRAWLPPTLREVLSWNLDAPPIGCRDLHVHVAKERVVSDSGCRPLLQPPCPGARCSVVPTNVQRGMTTFAHRLCHKKRESQTAPRATRGTKGVALCTPFLLVSMREWRPSSNRSESEGAPDEQPSGLTAKTPPGSESPRRKMPNTASHVATRQDRLMILVHQKERAKLVSTRSLHGPIVPRIPSAHQCTRSRRSPAATLR